LPLSSDINEFAAVNMANYQWREMEKDAGPAGVAEMTRGDCIKTTNGRDRELPILQDIHHHVISTLPDEPDKFRVR